MTIGTSSIGVDPATGQIVQCVGSSITPTPSGNANVVYGNQTSVPDGIEIPSGSGAPYILVAGTVTATSGVIIQRVTITPAA